MFFLALRDVQVRYRQAIVGVVWAVLQPLFLMGIFYLIFGRLAGIPSHGIPYELFALAGLSVWTFTVSAVGRGSTSLVADANLISKVYFPRLILPLASVIAWLPDLAIALTLLFGLAIARGYADPTMMLAIPFISLVLITVVGVVLIAGALNVAYRDVQHAIPFLLQIWFFLSPVLYPTSLLPDTLQPFHALNPLTTAIEGLRWSVLGGPTLEPLPVAISILTAVLLLMGGLFYFRRVEHGFADVI